MPAKATCGSHPITCRASRARRQMPASGSLATARAHSSSPPLQRNSISSFLLDCSSCPTSAPITANAAPGPCSPVPFSVQLSASFASIIPAGFLVRRASRIFRAARKSTFRIRAIPRSSSSPMASANSAATDCIESREPKACFPRLPARITPFSCPFLSMGIHAARRSSTSGPTIGRAGTASRSCMTHFPANKDFSGSGGSTDRFAHSAGISPFSRSHTNP